MALDRLIRQARALALAHRNSRAICEPDTLRIHQIQYQSNYKYLPEPGEPEPLQTFRST